MKPTGQSQSLTWIARGRMAFAEKLRWAKYRLDSSQLRSFSHRTNDGSIRRAKRPYQNGIGLKHADPKGTNRVKQRLNILRARLWSWMLGVPGSIPRTPFAPECQQVAARSGWPWPLKDAKFM